MTFYGPNDKRPLYEEDDEGNITHYLHGVLKQLLPRSEKDEKEWQEELAYFKEHGEWKDREPEPERPCGYCNDKPRIEGQGWCPECRDRVRKINGNG